MPDVPQETAILLASAILLDSDTRRLFAYADIGERHRNQQQLGEDQHGHTNAGCQREITNHRNIDDYQNREPNDVAQQGR
ncbi:hypothetical protein D3C80_1012380 [compost metagenome]